MGAARSADTRGRATDRGRRIERDLAIGALLVIVGFIIFWKAGEKAFFAFFGVAYLVVRLQRLRRRR
jgi:hypothetical protein